MIVMNTVKMRELLKGIGLCLVIALPAWLLGKQFPVIGGPVIGMLSGILMAELVSKKSSKDVNTLPIPGIRYTSKKLLQYAIILLGFSMNLKTVIEVGGQTLSVMVFTLSAAFLVAYFLGKALGLSGRTTTLIGVGTSICGGSAIAATAPVIGATEDEIAHSISTIFLFNLIAVVLFPFLGRLFGMSDLAFGIWAGTAINDTSSVVAAAVSWSDSSGNQAALELATIVKLTRTLMIVPITLFLAVYHTKRAQLIENGSLKVASSETLEPAPVKRSLAAIFPWFVLGFVAAALAGTLNILPAGWSNALTDLGKFMIVMAMSAIGLSTSLRKLLKNGLKPIFLGLCCWAAVAVVSIIVQRMMGLW